jgi:PBSX family phage terminase large subunit
MALSEKQIKSIVEATHRFNVWVGAVRSGKTFASIIKLIDLLKNGPPGDVMIIGVNRESIGRNVLSDLYKLLGVPKPSDKITRVRLYNRDVYFVGAHDEGSVRRIQGATLAIAYVDEVACVPQPFFRMLESRLSIKGAQLLATANPEGPSHWLKKQYIDRQGDESLDLISWHFTLDDNPALDQKYKESLKASFTGMWYKRLILGEWAVSHGLIFDAYDHLNTFREDVEFANYYLVGVDYGTSNATAAVLAAVTPTKWPQIRVVDEYYYDSVKEGRQKTDDELADDIYKLCRFNQVRAVYVDPSAASLKIELRNRNLPVLDAKNDVLEGIKVVSKFVANKNLVIHESCKTLIEVIQSYCWDPKAADRGEDKPLKKREHCMDALRYLCFSAFPQGSFGHPDENLTIDQIRRQVYSDDEHDAFGSMAHQGYF